MSMQSRITQRLTEALRPSLLQVIDESAQHAGHAGTAGRAGETHFRILIAAAELVGKSRVMQHRLINELMAPEFEAGLHALAIEVRPVG